MFFGILTQLKNWRSMLMKTKAIIFTVCVIVLALSSFYCQKQTSTETNNDIVRELIDEAWNKGNFSVIDELLSPNYILHIDAPGAKNREGYKQAVAMYRSAFPDFHFTIEDMISDGDKVAIRATMVGTQKGEIMGFAPTGKKLTTTAISIRRFENGKIVEEWVETNMLGFMKQIGAMHKQGTPSE